ncbi:MAG: ribosome biogenesis GTPase Der [Candidatus Sedimenticola endophacoides]|uniref:GTPase Der n=2 Tax=Candidatus Sedimenticola endophacoides TaxID=2548426 RepID=A0A6N4DYE5_9GAMM|nr:MAG: ribosome biogenesis GTPase Der [Candidatus Sedimenticola endophacoides]OQX42275.1 MAG: ribosome biogenesis GTPase Der [Candidatus Sedimenticola endophacoides]OQX44469.1 MAG: ribosome biogenesis GTPase Der [Candidatus Sedimenticola endophacoides]PUE00440.1 MAG: ribosome biogenesis GTPase Der [Candidatus Sedimenticola endophacoides]PUE02085.1 MAG: ribosome biogenesis GTPase Der [Candidatus Sedimenticola endophacoides]
MLPVIALVGRPNVGKSTLFNRLTRTRDALVADQPGLTRDRKYGIGKLGNRPYVVIDTGGISEEGGIDAVMQQQVMAAIGEADHVLFLLDARAGCTGGDQSIAEQLRRTGKPITVVANKGESLDAALAGAEFHALGLGPPVVIAAAHGHGVRPLVNELLKDFPEDAGEGEDAPRKGVRIAVVGRPNVGKSTLVNRLLGEERVVAFDQPGTTRDSIHIDFTHDERPYTLIDTAGVRRRARVSEAIEKFSVIKTLQAIDECNVVLLVLDARQGIGEQDATLAGHVLDSGRALVVAINKWDGLSQEQREEVKTELQRKLPFLDFATRRFISALHGSGVGNLYEAIDAAYANATRKLATPELTRILEWIVQEHQPPKVHGRRIKLRYAHQGGQNPPIIVIHGNQTASVPDTYKRFLVSRFRQALKLDGTPIRIEFRSGENPFDGQPNKLKHLRSDKLKAKVQAKGKAKNRSSKRHGKGSGPRNK